MLFKSVSEFRAAGLPWRWPNFTPEELACKCNGRHCGGEYYHDPNFLDLLQALRIRWGAPLIVNSGHRCVAHNKAVGGAKNSRHIFIAADIRTTGYDLAERRQLYALATAVGFTGIGRAKTFLHVDNRPGKLTEWFYGDSHKHW